MAMGITQALKLQEGPINALAQLPQQQLMAMAQQGRIPADMLPIILNEKAQMAQAAANMQAMQQPTPPSVIEQAMAINAQSETPEIPEQSMMGAEPQQDMYSMDAGVASLPVDDSMYNMAGGGIVAFQAGGDISYRGNKLKHPYEDMIIENARRRGEDPLRDLEILYRETGGIKNVETAVSPRGATGIMQILPSTAAKPGYGVPDIFALAERKGIRVPVKSEFTAGKLLENPELNAEFGSLYRSAMQKQFKDNPTLAAAAYNAGPGAVTRAGGVPNIAETQRYVAGISPSRQEAAAKKVQAARREQMGLEPANKDFLAGSVMLGKDKPPTEYSAAPKSKQQEPVTEGLGSTFDPFLEATGTPTVRVPEPPISMPKEEGAKIKPDAKEEPATASATEAIKKVLEGEGKETKGESFASKLEKLLADREGRISAQRKEDKNLAMLAAGLGILGGSSPYAAQNIGTGALKGVEQYGAARKLTRGEEEDILAGRLGQYKIEQQEGLRRGLEGEKQEAKYLNMMQNARRSAMNNIVQARKLDFTSMDQNQLTNLEREADALLSRDPAYQAMYKKIYGEAYNPGPSGSANVDYGKMYGLTPKKS